MADELVATNDGHKDNACAKVGTEGPEDGRQKGATKIVHHDWHPAQFECNSWLAQKEVITFEIFKHFKLTIVHLCHLCHLCRMESHDTYYN